MASLPTPTTQAPPTSSWRSKMSVAMVAEMLKKGSARSGSPSNSQDSADSRNLSTATTNFDQERGTQENKVPGESYTTFDGPRSVTASQAALPPDTPAPAPAPVANNPMAGNGDIEYTNLNWWQCGMCMVAETISLGILSLPKALSTLGLVVGLILLVTMGALASYSGYIIGQFKLRYPDIHNMGHAGTKLFGKWGGYIIGIPTLAFIVFIMGAHILAFKIMMAVLTDMKYCGLLWSAVGLALSFLACVPRTMKNMSYMSAASFVSIIIAVLITMAAIIKFHPGADGDLTHLNFHARAWPKSDLPFHSYFGAVTSIVFAYAGHVAFFAFISELRNPQDFNKALAFLQISDTSMYIIAATVLYLYGGGNIKSPALSSAKPPFNKAAYGVASVTIIIAGVVNGHIAIKTAYVALNKRMGGQMMHQRTFKSIGIWIGITAALWILAFILNELIPVFDPFVGLTGALFGSWFTFGCPALFWMHMNLGSPSVWFNPLAYHKAPGIWSARKYMALAGTWVLFLATLLIFFAGSYASIRGIMDAAKTAGAPFACHAKCAE